MLIAVTNQSTRVSMDEAALMTRAVAHQLRYHAAPLWDRHYPPCLFLPDPGMVSLYPGARQLVLFDDADQQGALGYHDETPDGTPYGRVFAATTMGDGGGVLTGDLSVSSVLSHEALEMWVDAACRSWVDDGNGKLYALEVGDPVESDSYHIQVGATAVAVSNFVTPEWFDPQAPAGSRFDWLKLAPGPFKMTPGGYVIVATEGGVTNEWGRDYPESRKALKGVPAARTLRRAQGSTFT